MLKSKGDYGGASRSLYTRKSCFPEYMAGASGSVDDSERAT